MLRANSCWCLAWSAVLVACGSDLTLPETGEGGGPPAGPEPPGGHVVAALDDRYSTFEDARALAIPAPGVLANDQLDGAGSTALEAALVDAPAHGRLELRADGSLDYTPDPDWFGLDRFTYRATVAGAESPAAEAVIDVQPVNDPPNFVAGPDQFVERHREEQTVVGWARDIAAGPPNEAGQQVSFVVDIVSGERVLKGAPTIDPDGTLRFRPSKHEGTALLEVRLRDDGGTANGGADTGAPHTLAITVSH